MKRYRFKPLEDPLETSDTSVLIRPNTSITIDKIYATLLPYANIQRISIIDEGDNYHICVVIRVNSIHVCTVPKVDVDKHNPEVMEAIDDALVRAMEPEGLEIHKSYIDIHLKGI